MSTRPSFAALYRQSRYARTDPDPHHATRQNRQELFAVAGVAFVMAHDDSFRRTFLRGICDVPETDLGGYFEVEIQPVPHADLRIRCRATRALYVVEFKVGAQLEPHQDPSQKEAFWREPTGYGAMIASSSEYADCLQKTYCVLQAWPGFNDGEMNGLRLRSRTWKHLVDHSTPESPLTRDLLDTLGGWGIASLRFRHTTGMQKARHTNHAADIFQIITAVAEELGIREGKHDFDVQAESGDGAYFGLNVKFPLKRFTELESLAGQIGCWFGYSSDESHGSTLDVWIYCAAPAAVPTAQSDTLAYAQKRLGASFSGAIRSQEGHVRISISGDAVPDDKEWFANLFEALRDQLA